ncbi:MAG: hypothetical protein U1E51_17340 [Candidatus Binatia bacterium]|nr:hypothetical protein [Candidatus Binatia bacterium]
MSEASLWDSIRNHVGHRGHFTRIEFNPEAGVPDVDYCLKSEEGKIELKYIDAAPARASTQVFGDGGLRDSQIAWIFTRVRHGGRVWILPQIGRELYLVPGKECRRFNSMPLHLIRKAAVWSAAMPITSTDWEDLLIALRSRF